MSDEGIAARLAALDTAWEWLADAPSRVDGISTDLAALKSRLEAIGDEDVNKKALILVETNEQALPELSEKLDDSQHSFDENRDSFETTSAELTKRVEETKAQVG